MANTGPYFTLTPQPWTHDGSRVRFNCQECGHAETFVRLAHADVAPVLGNDHYRGDCPAVHWTAPESPEHAAHREKMRARHRRT